ncbi:MAG: hypothetical protein QNJ29_02555 [Rhizobiaceae bacterium]|nr:hypothetical protein [Rhizobiaceae bacterium]
MVEDGGKIYDADIFYHDHPETIPNELISNSVDFGPIENWQLPTKIHAQFFVIHPSFCPSDFQLKEFDNIHYGRLKSLDRGNKFGFITIFLLREDEGNRFTISHNTFFYEDDDEGGSEFYEPSDLLKEYFHHLIVEFKSA